MFRTEFEQVVGTRFIKQRENTLRMILHFVCHQCSRELIVRNPLSRVKDTLFRFSQTKSEPRAQSQILPYIILHMNVSRKTIIGIFLLHTAGHCRRICHTEEIRIFIIR